MSSEDRLRPTQREVLDRWFPGHVVVADHSWSDQTLVVLELRTADGEHVLIKASTTPAFDHHIDREARAHRTLGARLGDGFQRLLRHDDGERLLAFGFLPGVLVEGTEWEREPAVHRAAGQLLARLHTAGDPVPSDVYAATLAEQTAAHLRRADGLAEPAALAAAAAHLLDGTPTVELVPTHGDHQPRNWLIDPSRSTDSGPEVALIDLGRFGWRPWYSDLVRLHHGVFQDRPDLRTAMLEGMGRATSPSIGAEEQEGWDLENLHQSLGTIVWATDMGLGDFAERGRSMLRRTLAQWGTAPR